MAKPQDSHRIKQMQMCVRSQDCSKVKVYMIWLATEGGSRYRDGRYFIHNQPVRLEKSTTSTRDAKSCRTYRFRGQSPRDS